MFLPNYPSEGCILRVNERYLGLIFIVILRPNYNRSKHYFKYCGGLFLIPRVRNAVERRRVQSHWELFVSIDNVVQVGNWLRNG